MAGKPLATARKAKVEPRHPVRSSDLVHAAGRVLFALCPTPNDVWPGMNVMTGKAVGRMECVDLAGLESTAERACW